VVLAAARMDCFDLLPEVFAAVEPLLAASAPRLRICAASAAAMLSRHPDLVAHRPRLLAYHLAECVSDDAYRRASMLLGTGELDGAPREWLRDPLPGVRVCAALAPALADDPEATAVLLTEATRNPAVIDMQAFEGMMALTVLPHAAAVLAEQLCRSVGDVEASYRRRSRRSRTAHIPRRWRGAPDRGRPVRAIPACGLPRWPAVAVSGQVRAAPTRCGGRPARSRLGA
jgi:hypothetical protein